MTLYKSNVYIPTTYKVEGRGFSYQHVPISVVPVGEAETLRRAVLAAVARGNPEISLDKYLAIRDAREGSLPEAAGCKSWRAFDRGITGIWNITDRDGPYQIQVDEPMKPWGWHEDKEKRVKFPESTSIEDVISRVIAMIQQSDREGQRVSRVPIS